MQQDPRVHITQHVCSVSDRSAFSVCRAAPPSYLIEGGAQQRCQQDVGGKEHQELAKQGVHRLQAERARGLMQSGRRRAERHMIGYCTTAPKDDPSVQPGAAPLHGKHITGMP